MNWYKRAAVDQTLTTTLFNILWESYHNPGLIVDLHSRLGIAPNYTDPTTLGDSLQQAQQRFFMATGEQGLNEAQNNIVMEIQKMLEDGVNSVDGLTETTEIMESDFGNDQGIAGPVY